MTIRQAEHELRMALSAIYESNEAAAIADLVMERITSYAAAPRRLKEHELLPESTIEQLAKIKAELLAHRPVQYVLGVADFYGMSLAVDEHVLIPRPETEELVDLIIKKTKTNTSPHILDIGTGSGCIAIALKKNLPEASVIAMDISEEALELAKLNANKYQLPIDFIKVDILDECQWNGLPSFDIIVSNPPYITLEEKQSLAKNVRAFEPASALFVTNNDPHQFYKAISAFSKTNLKSDGHLFLEVHQGFAAETKQHLEKEGWTCQLFQDLNANDRMLHCQHFTL